MRSGRVVGNTIAIASISYLIHWITLCDKSPIVETKDGQVQGFTSFSRNGRRYFEFLGIPFGRPPVGEYRFEPPAKSVPWTGVLEALKMRKPCKGFDMTVLGTSDGVEDCLYLNVRTPANLTFDQQTSLLPVIVFFHGGAFQSGTNSIYRGKYFMDQDVVLVTMSYRVGIYGFLSTNDSVVPGNMGLKDQVLALKWVQENIRSFGGNAGQVTIMGSSAGGVSVHLHTLSNMTTGLFHRAITLNLASTSDFLQMHRNGDVQIQALSKHFKCPAEDSKLFAQCLKRLDAEELMDFQRGSIIPKYYRNPTIFGPVPEPLNGSNAFITDTPWNLLNEGMVVNKVPWMVGVDEYEGLLLAGMLLHYKPAQNLLKDAEVWDEYCHHMAFFDKERRPDASLKIRENYFGNRTFELDEHEAILQVAALVSDRVFRMPLEESAILQSKFALVYAFKYNYQSLISCFDFVRYSIPGSWLPSELSIAYHMIKDRLKRILFWWIKYPQYGPSHGDEMGMLFNLVLPLDLIVSYYDLDMSQQMVKTFSDFAANKPLTFKTLPWPKVETSKPLVLMDMTAGDPQIVLDPFGHRLKFWRGLDLPRE